MAKKLVLENLIKLAQGIGANPQKFMGTRTNISFLGKGPTKNPLFQGPLRGLESAGEAQLGPRETIISTVEDAMGYASAGKLNSIQIRALELNLKNLNNIYNPPVLPSASVTNIAPGIEGLRRFPKETHRFMGRPLKDKDFAAIDRLVQEGKLPPAVDPSIKQFNKDFAARVAAQADLPQKTAVARATMIRLLDVPPRAEGVGMTLRETMSKQDLKWLLEGGGGAEGEPIAIFARYFGPVTARQIPSGGTPDVIEEFAKQVIRRKDSLGRRIDDPFFNPDDITFAGGGLAEILQVPRSGYSKGRAVKTLNRLIKELRLKKASDLPKGTKYEELEAIKAFEQRHPIVDTAETKRINKILRKFDITPSQALEEQKIIAKKYGNLLDDDLLRNLLYDMNPQHQAQVMATIDEMLIMQNVKGMGPDSIIQAVKESWKRKPSASGGLARVLEV